MSKINGFAAGVAFAATVLGASMAGGAAQAAKVFDFSYSGAGVSGSGVITTGDAGSPFTITAISGTANGEAITGLSTYAGADNLLYFPTEPFVDFSGIAFSTATKDWGLGYTGSAYGIVNSVDNPGGSCCGVTPLAFSVTAAPEPATWAMMMLGFGGLGASLRSRRKAAAAA